MTLLDLYRRRKHWSELARFAESHGLNPKRIAAEAEAGKREIDGQISDVIERPVPFVPTVVAFPKDDGTELLCVWVEDRDGKHFLPIVPLKAQDIKVAI